MDVTRCQQSPSCSTLFFLFQLLRSEVTFVPLMFVPPLVLHIPILPTSVLCAGLLDVVLLIFYQLAFTCCIFMKCNENVKQDLYLGWSLTNSFSSLSWLDYSLLRSVSCQLLFSQFTIYGAILALMFSHLLTPIGNLSDVLPYVW